MAGEDFFRSYYEAYNSEDPAKLGALLADDVVLASAMGETKGYEGVNVNPVALDAAGCPDREALRPLERHLEADRGRRG